MKSSIIKLLGISLIMGPIAHARPANYWSSWASIGTASDLYGVLSFAPGQGSIEVQGWSILLGLSGGYTQLRGSGGATGITMGDGTSYGVRIITNNGQGPHLSFSPDALADIGTYNGGTILERPRDIWNSRDLHIGRELRIAEGANQAMGVATLSGGTVTVSNTLVTSSTRIFVSTQTPSGTQGFLSTSQVAGTSFTITSTSASDASTVAWLLIEPN